MFGVTNKFFHRFYIIPTVFGVVGVLFVATQGVYAQSQINATLCDARPPSITVSSPKSDSITDQLRIPLKGSAVRTTQLDVFVNSQYATSIAVSGNGAFSSEVTINEGTNTILLRGYYSCNQTSAEEKLVVTLETAATQPDQADTTKTGQAGSLYEDTISNPDQSQTPSIITPAERILRKLSFTDNSFVLPLFSWICVIGMLLGTFLLLRPRYTTELVERLVHRQPYRLTTKSATLLRTVGALIIIIFATILQA